LDACSDKRGSKGIGNSAGTRRAKNRDEQEKPSPNQALNPSSQSWQLQMQLTQDTREKSKWGRRSGGWAVNSGDPEILFENLLDFHLSVSTLFTFFTVFNLISLSDLSNFCVWTSCVSGFDAPSRSDCNQYELMQALTLSHKKKIKKK